MAAHFFLPAILNFFNTTNVMYYLSTCILKFMDIGCENFETIMTLLLLGISFAPVRVLFSRFKEMKPGSYATRRLNIF